MKFIRLENAIERELRVLEDEYEKKGRGISKE